VIKGIEAGITRIITVFTTHAGEMRKFGLGPPAFVHMGQRNVSVHAVYLPFTCSFRFCFRLPLLSRAHGEEVIGASAYAHARRAEDGTYSTTKLPKPKPDAPDLNLTDDSGRDLLHI
jgi:hypothetical protein